MREIATRAGAATGAAYYYFDSKDAIVLAFLRPAPLLEDALAASKDLKERCIAFSGGQPHSRFRRLEITPAAPSLDVSNGIDFILDLRPLTGAARDGGADRKEPLDCRPPGEAFRPSTDAAIATPDSRSDGCSHREPSHRPECPVADISHAAKAFSWRELLICRVENRLDAGFGLAHCVDARRRRERQRSTLRACAVFALRGVAPIEVIGRRRRIYPTVIEIAGRKSQPD